MPSSNFSNIIPNVVALSFICLALAAGMIFFAVITLLNLREIRRLKKRYAEFMYSGRRPGTSIEELLESCLEETRDVQLNFSSFMSRLAALENQIIRCFQKIGVIRYNPFNDTGGDLSYAIALLDNNNSGFVLNGIYNRSGSYTYAKEIENGVPVRHKLSAEEQEALQIAINCDIRRDFSS